MKTRLPVDTLKASDNTDAEDKANALNKYLQESSIMRIHVMYQLFLMYVFTDVLRADIQISGEDIYHKLCNLDFNNTPVGILVF